MPAQPRGGVGARIAYYRSVRRPKMTQEQLADAACVALGTIHKIERGERGVSDATWEAIANALGAEPGRLQPDRGFAAMRTKAPAASAAGAPLPIAPRERARALPRPPTPRYELVRPASVQPAVPQCLPPDGSCGGRLSGQGGRHGSAQGCESSSTASKTKCQGYSFGSCCVRRTPLVRHREPSPHP
jgi:transcriptional regulator with XRE-family HTH domain